MRVSIEYVIGLQRYIVYLSKGSDYGPSFQYQFTWDFHGADTPQAFGEALTEAMANVDYEVAKYAREHSKRYTYRSKGSVQGSNGRDSGDDVLARSEDGSD